MLINIGGDKENFIAVLHRQIGIAVGNIGINGDSLLREILQIKRGLLIKFGIGADAVAGSTVADVVIFTVGFGFQLV